MAQKYNMGPPEAYRDMKFGKPIRDKVAKPLKLDKEYNSLSVKQKAQYLRDVYYTTS